MLHRICKAMKDQASQYMLAGIVELDDAYFRAPNEGGKRSRVTGKAKVTVGLSLNDKGHPGTLRCRLLIN